MIEDRSQIHFLAALVSIQNNFKLSMENCLNLAEGSLAHASAADLRVQLQLAAEEAAEAQAAKPVTDKVQ